MSTSMNKEKIQALANELAKEVKTTDDLGQLSVTWSTKFSHPS